jgi:hypothetical protein
MALLYNPNNLLIHPFGTRRFPVGIRSEDLPRFHESALKK